MYNQEENIFNSISANQSDPSMFNTDSGKRKPEQSMYMQDVMIKTADGTQVMDHQEEFKEDFLFYEMDQVKKDIEKLKYITETKNDPEDQERVTLLDRCTKHLKQIEEWVDYYENVLCQNAENAKQRLETLKQDLKDANTFYI